MMNKETSKALEVLRAGGVIAHATDTCYGFACDIFSEVALKKLYALKQMHVEKPVSIMVSSLDEAMRYGIFSAQAEALARKYWPGALTIVVPRNVTLPKFLNVGTDSIGIRMPAHELSLTLLKDFVGPLTTTSANITTQPSPYSVEDIHAQFDSQPLKPDFIIDSGILPKNPPSTIVDCTGQELRVIRQGAVYIMPA